MGKFVLLVFFVGLVVSEEIDTCSKFCSFRYDDEDKKACDVGCAHRTETIANLAINSECKETCDSQFEMRELKAACYDGCTYVKQSELEPEPSGFEGGLFGLSSMMHGGMMNRMVSMMNSIPHTVGQPVLHKLRIRIFIPDNEEVRSPQVEDLHDMMRDIPNMIEDHPSSKSLGGRICHKIRGFVYYMTARPLFFASVLFLIINIILLLIFCLIRLRVRRLHRVAHRRQMEKIAPAFLVPAAMKINLSSPQPFFKFEADELPEKVPLV